MRAGLHSLQPLLSLMSPPGRRPSQKVGAVGGASGVGGVSGVGPSSSCPSSSVIWTVLPSAVQLIHGAAAPSGAPCRTTSQTLSFCSAAKKKTPIFTVGRFQVTPSLAPPPQPRPLWQATPTAHSPPPPMPSQSESSESSSASDGSVRTAPGFHGYRLQREEEVFEGEESGGAGRRASVSLWEGPGSSPAACQSRGRTVPTASSDESESESEECPELQQLRER